MEDAIRATIQIMKSPPEQIKIRTAYNLAGISFTPEDLANAIAAKQPGFSIKYDPDFRQAIAESWPNSIDDEHARKDWGWEIEYDLMKMVDVMLHNVDISRLP